MTSDQAENRLTELLSEAGVDIARPTAEDVEKTWAVMRRFADEPVEDCQPREEEGDGLLAQYGSYGQSIFQLDMTRQFTFADEAGEYDHMAQLNCTFLFDASDELVAAGEDSVWSFDLTMEEFFETALALPGFRAVRDSGQPPRELAIVYSDV